MLVTRVRGQFYIFMRSRTKGRVYACLPLRLLVSPAKLMNRFRLNLVLGFSVLHDGANNTSIIVDLYTLSSVRSYQQKYPIVWKTDMT